MGAEIQLSTKETNKGINITCHPGVGSVMNIFRYWNVLLPDNKFVRLRHPIAGVTVRLNMSEGVVIVLLHPVKSFDQTFGVTVLYGNAFGGKVSVSCGVKLSGGLDWSQPVQISPTRDQLTQNATLPSSPGEQI